MRQSTILAVLSALSIPVLVASMPSSASPDYRPSYGYFFKGHPEPCEGADPNDFVFLSHKMYCGETLIVTNTETRVNTTVTNGGLCRGCHGNDLVMQKHIFKKLGGRLEDGRIPITWAPFAL